MHKININDNFKLLDFEIIYWGIKNDIIDIDTACSYADIFVSTYPEHCVQSVIDILLSGNCTKEEMLELLRNVNTSVIFKDEKKCMTVLRYIILSELQMNISNNKELLSALEDVYADFDYPSDMSGFIGYMPADGEYDPTVHTYQENESRLMSKFKEFMIVQKSAVTKDS